MSPRKPAAPAPAKGERLTAAQAAARVPTKAGTPTKVDTFWSYVNRARAERKAGRDRPGLAPEPDGYDDFSGRPFWYPATIDRFAASRVGRGFGGGRPKRTSGS